MTPLLAAAGHAPLLAPEALLAGRSALVVVAPHPDDETLGAALPLRAAHRLGLPATIICLTDGAASHPRSRVWPPARMAARRADELARAVACLAPGARIVRLGRPDGALRSDGAAAGRTARRIAAEVPTGALVLAAWGGDPHADHRAGARLVRAALARRRDAALWFYPIWGRFSGAPAPARLVRLAAEAEDAAAKRAALAAHATQMSPLVPDDPDGFVMAEAHQRHFLTHPEILIAEASDRPPHGAPVCAPPRSVAPPEQRLRTRQA